MKRQARVGLGLMLLVIVAILLAIALPPVEPLVLYFTVWGLFSIGFITFIGGGE